MKARFCYLQAWGANVLLLSFSQEGMNVHILVLSIHYKFWTFTFFCFSATYLGRIFFPQWTPPSRKENCRRWSITLPREPFRSRASLLVTYSHVMDHTFLAGLQMDWSICLVCRHEWKLPAINSPKKSSLSHHSGKHFSLGEAVKTHVPCLKHL